MPSCLSRSDPFSSGYSLGFVLKEGGEKLVVGASEAANANDEFIDQFFNGKELFL
jgi:hypothetical protein